MSLPAPPLSVSASLPPLSLSFPSPPSRVKRPRAPVSLSLPSPPSRVKDGGVRSGPVNVNEILSLPSPPDITRPLEADAVMSNTSFPDVPTICSIFIRLAPGASKSNAPESANSNLDTPSPLDVIRLKLENCAAVRDTSSSVIFERIRISTSAIVTDDKSTAPDTLRRRASSPPPPPSIISPRPLMSAVFVTRIVSFPDPQ